MRRLILLLAVPAALSGCDAPSTPSSVTDHDEPAPEDPPDCDPSQPPSEAELTFHPSPGGVPEVSPAWVHSNGCHVRVVDVREPEELVAGRIPGVEHVPLGDLGRVASHWNPREPVVLVCRSGRRSARGVHLLESLGFDRAASMTGGMIRWDSGDLPTVVGEHEPTADGAGAATDDYEGPPTEASMRRFLESAPLRRVRAAALLMQGTEACVDGREEHAVLGTPGGDAGELLLALSTLEELTGRELSEAEIVEMFEAYVEGFGRFYIHTDDHALEALGDTLYADPRFHDAHPDPELRAVEPHTVAWAEAIVRRPPLALRDALLERLVEAENIGCGHLRLVTLHPDEYGVRPGLTRRFLRVVFRMLWRKPELVDFAVLHGDHEEEAVVNVRVAGGVHAFSNVPAVPPKIGNHSVFVNHPEVAAFLRSQHARFLLEQTDSASRGVSLEEFEAALARRAHRQLEATVTHLAPELPVFDVELADGVHVERVR